jgi:LysW-gamma-L-lysine/LysW-L-ornithine aminotransferase
VSAADARAVEFACSPKREPTFVRGSQATLWDDAGNEYIDCGASFGVGNLGHCNPAIVEAIVEQARALIHIGPSFGTTAKATFVDRLLSVAPRNLERVFLSNSGSEAVEAAIKFARAATGRKKIVAAMRGFHGRTMGALSATWRRDFREPFEPLVPGFTHVPFNDVEALQKAVDGETAAVLLEAVQGEGGVHVASPEYLPAAREVCDRAGALLILDEVQTGMGRTGRLFAVERWGVEPDLMTLAKSLAGGVPIGATLATQDVERAFKGSHTSTFGGNPLACAAGTAAIEYTVREKLWERAERMGASGIATLRGLDAPSVREVRGLGLMIGIELRGKSGPVLHSLQEEGILAIGGGSSVVRLLPPLVIPDEQWSTALGVLGRVLGHG